MSFRSSYGPGSSRAFVLPSSARRLAVAGLVVAMGCSFAADEGADGADESGFLTGSGASESSDTSSGAQEDGEGGDEMPQLDMMTPDCDAPCDPYDADTCASGEKCVPAACGAGSGTYDAHVCRPVTGSGRAGDPCIAEGQLGFDDCAEGLICWGVDANSGEGHCEPLCKGDPEAPTCTEGRVCATFGMAQIDLCVELCDPLAQDCSVEAVACLPVPGGDRFACLPSPSEGGAGFGEPCAYANACAPGFLCIDGSLVPKPGCDETQDCCSPLCDLLLPEPCPGQGQLCSSLDPGLNVAEAHPNVGVCALP